MNATNDLKQDHLIVRRFGEITQRCSERLYASAIIPFEDLDIISVVIEEFVDRFHHGKEEQAYFPETIDKDSFLEAAMIEFQHIFKIRLSESLSRSTINNIQ